MNNQKQRCTQMNCSKARENNFNNEHIYSMLHFCINEKNCPLLYDRTHCHYFYHDKPFKLISTKKKCPDFEDCKLLGDTDHKESYFHFCKCGKDCKSITDEVHLNRFVHPCPEGTECKDKLELHQIQFFHLKELQFCLNPKTCKEKSKLHALTFRHFCTILDCSKTNDEEHKKLFIHPCKFGVECRYQEVGKHTENFAHPCKYSEKCKFLMKGDLKHMCKFTHEISSFKNSLTINWPVKDWISPLPPKITSFKGNHFNIVPLATTSTEYQNVSTLFKQFIQPNIISIERIENYLLWISYSNKHQILQNYGKEMKLFHGTAVTLIPTIAKCGFDFRVSSLGGAYGGGTYFSPSSAKSNGYTKPDPNGVKKMFVVRVSVGDSIVETSTTPGIREPRKNTNTNRPYDTIISSNNLEYIVFDNAQSYPEYIITYK
jgi:hypothetical protein